MRYVAAYFLAALGGKKEPSAADVQKILASVGIDAEGDKVQKVITELKGKVLEDIIAEGTKKLSTMPTGGAVASSGAAPSAAGAPAKEEAKKEEKKESEESEDDDMGFGLFD
eukprot:TRINITY_DN124568_c0_g2_i1.p1 TRINITY_DN124568_c0_g2~~TRINITY_DN124568_c0_g2_i1.p1  ORF type:complete len:112 (-),score=43.27 TRINITY_DN124568_c0_g2_i1:69-404(-)